MASVLKVDKLDPQSGTALEIGSSGDTITIPSGATFTQSGTMNASAITAGTVATARLGTGTASSSTVLYGDQTYKAEPGGANTPSFFAYLSANQALSDSTETKIEIDTEIYDTDSDYDNTTNYRFTPTTAGKYVIFGTVSIFQDDGSDLKIAQILWYKNGSKLYETHDNYTSNYLRGTSQSMSVVMDMNGSSDYVEMYAEIQIASGENNLRVESTNRRTVFGAYKLIGV